MNFKFKKLRLNNILKFKYFLNLFVVYVKYT